MNYAKYQRRSNKLYLDNKDTGYSVVSENITVYRVKDPEGNLTGAMNLDRTWDLCKTMAEQDAAASENAENLKPSAAE